MRKSIVPYSFMQTVKLKDSSQNPLVCKVALSLINLHGNCFSQGRPHYEHRYGHLVAPEKLHMVNTLKNSYIKFSDTRNGHRCPRLKNLNANCKRHLGHGRGWMDRGNTISPFHHSSNGRGIKMTYANSEDPDQTAPEGAV